MSLPHICLLLLGPELFLLADVRNGLWGVTFADRPVIAETMAARSGFPEPLLQQGTVFRNLEDMPVLWTALLDAQGMMRQDGPLPLTCEGLQLAQESGHMHGVLQALPVSLYRTSQELLRCAHHSPDYLI